MDGQTLKDSHFLCCLANSPDVTARDFKPLIISAKLEVGPPAPAGPVAILIISSLKVISVSNPSSPSLTATVPVTATAGDDETLFIDGNTAYTISSNSTNILDIVDVTDINAPAILSSTPFDSAGSGNHRIAVLTDFLLVIRANNLARPNTLEVLDISDKTAPDSLALYDLMLDFALPQNSADLLLSGTTGFISGDNGAPDFQACIGAYDFSALPVVTQINVSLFDAPGSELDILDVQADVAYCVLFTAGSTIELQAYDVSDPANPVLLGGLTAPTDVIIYTGLSGGIIYGSTLSTLDKKVYAFDFSDPTTPVLLGSTLIATRNNFAIGAASNYVYLATRKGSLPRNRTIQIYDATNPAALVLLGEVLYNPLGGNSNLAILTQ